MQQDIHKLIENAIYLHFSEKQYEVIYIQATYLLADESTRLREFGNLQAINNNYPKYVVSLDEWTSGSNVGRIKHIHLAEFLKDRLK